MRPTGKRQPAARWSEAESSWSGIELVRVDATDREATARSEMERSGIELARVDAAGRKVPSIPSR